MTSSDKPPAKESGQGSGASEPAGLSEPPMDLRSQGVAFGLPAVEGWQQVPYASGGELTWDASQRYARRRNQLKPSGPGSDQTGIRLGSPISVWQESRAEKENGQQTYSYWIHTDGTLLVGSPTDPLAFGGPVEEPFGSVDTKPDVPIEHQAKPMMAADGVVEGVTVIGGGSEPKPDRSPPADNSDELEVRGGCSPVVKLGMAGAFGLIVAVLAALGFGFLGGSGGDTTTAGESVAATDSTENQSDNSGQNDDGGGSGQDEESSSGDGLEAENEDAADPVVIEPLSFKTNDVGRYHPVSADAAEEARTAGALIEAGTEQDAESPVTVDEITVDVDGYRVAGAVSLAEATGPFGIGFVLATEDGSVVATHTKQAMGGPDGIQVLGSTTTVNSHGFQDGGDELTQVVTVDASGPMPIGADNTISIDWNLMDDTVPTSWGQLREVELQLLVIIDVAPGDAAEFQDIAFRRAGVLIGVVRFDATTVFPGGVSVKSMTLTELRIDGFVRAGLPQETATCLVEDIPLRVEILVSFRPAQQEPLLMMCLLQTQFFTSVAAEGLQQYVFDGTLDVACLSSGMAVHIPDIATYILFATADHSSWPSGLVEAYAEVLEICVPLEPFYLAQFGQYDFTDGNCPVTMTNHVLTFYSWLLFIQEGIISSDAEKQRDGLARFNDHVNRGYTSNVCVVEAAD